MSGSNENGNREISAEVSNRICAHMNDDHAVSVYAMTRSILTLPSGWKLSDARVKTITLSGCQIQAIACRKDLCERHIVMYPFEPILKDVSQARPRLISIHHKETRPKLQWLISKPHSVMILIVWIFAITAQFSTRTSLTKMIERSNVLLLTNNVFTVKEFMVGVDTVFYITAIGHSGMVAYCIYMGLTKLKLSVLSISQWVIAVAAVGFPYLVELQNLVTVPKQSKGENKHS